MVQSVMHGAITAMHGAISVVHGAITVVHSAITPMHGAITRGGCMLLVAERLREVRTFQLI